MYYPARKSNSNNKHNKSKLHGHVFLTLYWFVSVWYLLIPHITQIAAVEPESGPSFNCYIVPNVSMTASAQQITSIVVSDSLSMVINGNPVEAESVISAVQKLMILIESFPIMILVVHSGRRFDFPAFISTLTHLYIIPSFYWWVKGHNDSIHVVRKVFQTQASYTQVVLTRIPLQQHILPTLSLKMLKSLGTCCGMPTCKLRTY